MKAKIVDGQITKYPYTDADIRAEARVANMSIPAQFTPEFYTNWGVVDVVQTVAPTVTYAQALEESTPEFSTGVWKQVWAVRNKTPQEAQDYLLALQDNVVVAAQNRLDEFARTRNYDGVLSLCTYATSANPKFKQEGQYGVDVRDATWSKLYEILAEVQAGTRPVPSDYSEIEPELPELNWPEQ